MQKRHTIIFSLFIILLNSVVNSGPLEDVFGAGPRIQAMGGAGVSLSEDPSAVYYNPANLSRCEKRMVMMGYNLIASNLSVSANGQNLAFKDIHSIGNYHIGNLGACFPVISKFNFGFNLSTGVVTPLKLLYVETLTSRPRFISYDTNLRSPNVILGGSYSPLKGLSLGVGVIMSVGAVMTQSLTVPNFSSELLPELYPRLGVILGVNYEIMPNKLKMGVVFRQENSSHMKVKVKVGTIVTGQDFEIDSHLNYSPYQLAVGLAYRPFTSLLIGADATILFWELYEGPFMQGIQNGDPYSWWINKLNMPAKEDIPFRNIVVFRLGGELTLTRQILLRAGYAFLPGLIEMPKGRSLDSKSNLLSSSVHRATIGAGFIVYDNENVNLNLDSFVSLDFMPFRRVTNINSSNKYYNQALRYGGTVVNAGLALKIEY